MKENVTMIAIVLFIVIFATIQFMKPSFLFKTDGTLRAFGIGYKNKTIFPIWLFSIILGILCYLAVMCYLTYPRIMF
jgi:uncharacterized membrane protein YozB (DUF420 family)